MNYSLIVAVCSLAAGLVAMERWCSWRLGVSQKRDGALDIRSPGQAAGDDPRVVDPDGYGLLTE